MAIRTPCNAKRKVYPVAWSSNHEYAVAKIDMCVMRLPKSNAKCPPLT